MTKLTLAKALMYLTPVFCAFLLFTPFFALGILLFIIYVIALRRNQAKIIGLLGEWNSENVIRKTVKGSVFRDIYVKGDRGIQQIDLLAVTPKGVLVIEKKTYIGFISGGERSESWKVTLRKKSYTLKNPLHQNYGHIKALAHNLPQQEGNMVSIILFGNNAKLGKYLPQNVICDRDFARYYNGLPQRLTQEEINAVTSKVTELEANRADYKEEHREKIRNVG